MLITGASSGIGAATAKEAARQGAEVILVARTQPKLEAVADEIRSMGSVAHVYPADVSDADVVRNLATQVQSVHGTPDILFNNAGAGRWLFTEETEMEDAAEMMAAPYLAAFYITRAFLPGMLKRDSGYIVNMSSIAGFMPWPGATAYAAARWAMRGFTESLRADLHGTKLRTMLTAFAKVESDFWQNNPGSEDTPRRTSDDPRYHTRASSQSNCEWHPLEPTQYLRPFYVVGCVDFVLSFSANHALVIEQHRCKTKVNKNWFNFKIEPISPRI